MCKRSSLEIIHKARLVADSLLAELGVSKAMDLSDTDGFDRAVATLAAQLRARAKQPETSALRAVVGVLDVDWSKTSASQRRALIRQARAAVGGLTATIPARVQAALGPAADELVSATRSNVRAQGLSIAADFNAVDQRIIKHLTSTNGLFVTDEYGRRLSGFEGRALKLVSEGLEAGLGRDDIAASLSQAAEGLMVSRSGFYWEVVAGSFIGTGRSFSQISAYAEAGIHRYRIEAIQDEVTTEICRYLHGKTFEVRDGLDRFDAIDRLSSPQEIKSAKPWVREAVGEDGLKTLYIMRDGERTPITDVTTSALGSRDERGSFSRELSARELTDLGISFPPFHGLCRSQLIPEI